MYRKAEMKPLSETWKQKKHVPNSKADCSTPINSKSKVKLVQDVSPIDGFGNSELFCDAEFLRVIDDLERTHMLKQLADKEKQAAQSPKVEGEGMSSNVTTPIVHRRSQRLQRRQMSESKNMNPDHIENRGDIEALIMPSLTPIEARLLPLNPIETDPLLPFIEPIEAPVLVPVDVCFSDLQPVALVDKAPCDLLAANQSPSNLLTTPTPSSLLLSSWGLPEPVLERYRECGVESMFDWQVACLASERVLEGGNLVYSAPTSAGKTLVAEILILKCVLERKKKAIVILPFVSVALEKMHYLKKLFGDVGVRVDGYMAQHVPSGGFAKLDVAVCTIEKANGLMNRFLEDGNLDQIGIVVVDELHMVGDPNRGYLLELLLAKIRYMQKKSALAALREAARTSEESQPRLRPVLSIQIIGMSATLPNLNLLSSWLDADLYCTLFRPVPLTECVKVGLEVKKVLGDGTLSLTRVLKPSPIANDPDHVVQFCLETVADGHGVLVFCPAKQWCENLAETLAKEFFQLGKDDENINHGFANLRPGLRANLNGDSLLEVLGHLQKSPAGLDKSLAKTVPFGVAFHHAGLTMEERDILEAAFRQGVIKVLTATSTLSSGVNLPARRVIVRTPTSYYGSSLDTLTYRQMIGRAGRKGLDDQGESILICKTAEVTKAVNLVKSKLMPVSSALFANCQGTLSLAMKRAMLEIVVSGAASNPDELEAYAACTLLACSTSVNDKRPQDVIKDYIEFLVQNEFIRLQTISGLGGEEVRYSPTPLGRAVLASSLSPDEGLLVYKELEKARRCFVLENELHIIYQVTPIFLTEQWSKLDWLNYFELWERLSPDMKLVSSCVGVEERFLAAASRGRQGLKSDHNYTRQLSVHLRFYTALALHDLVNEMSLSKVARKYGCNKGMLQSLQQMAAVFSGMVTVFCHHLGWLNLELLLAQFQSRLHFGVHQELCDLVRLTYVNARRARNLHNAGYKTVAQLAVANPAIVENILMNSGPFQSEKQKDNENERDLAKRLKTKNIWLPGHKGITEAEAAALLIQEAREVVQKDLGVSHVEWSVEKPTKNHSAVVATDVSAGATALLEALPQNQSIIDVPVEFCTQQAILALVENCSVGDELRRSTSAEESSSLSFGAASITERLEDAAVAIREVRDVEDISKDKDESPTFFNCRVPSVNSDFSLTFGANQFLDRLVGDHVVGNKLNLAAMNSPRPGSPCTASELELTMSEADRSTPELLLENGSWTLASRNHPITRRTSSDRQADEGSQYEIVESKSPAWEGGNDALVSLECELTIDESSSDFTDEDDDEKAAVTDTLFPNDSVFEHSDLLTQNVWQRTDCDSKKRANSERLADESDSKKVCSPVRRYVETGSSNNSSSSDLIPPTQSANNAVGSSNVKRLLSSGGLVTPTIVIVRSRKPPASKLSVGEPAEIEQQKNTPADTTGEPAMDCGPANLYIGTAQLVVVTDERSKFAKFLSVWKAKRRFCISFAAERKAVSSVDVGIGRNIVKERRTSPTRKLAGAQLPSLRIYREEVMIVGMAVCWDESTIYYISFESGQTSINKVVDGVSNCLISRTTRKVIVAYDLKEQLKVLYEVFGGLPKNFEGQDPRVAAWLFDVTSANDNFGKFVSSCLPEDCALLTKAFADISPGSPGLSVSCIQKGGRHRAATEALLTLKLMDHQLIKLQKEKLVKGFKEIEMPIMAPFAKMELNGFGFNEKSFQHSRVLIQARIAQLEARAEELLGHTLNMGCKTALRNALYVELKLPCVEDPKSPAAHPSISSRMSISSASLASPARFMRGRRMRREESTIKERLRRLIPLHELPGIVLEWRRLQSALTQKVIPIMKEKMYHPQLKMHRVYSSAETHTLTGRSVLNLQMVERDFQMESRTSDANFLSQTDKFNLTTVSLRRAFVPYRGGVLVSADYSQLELRILAHLSEEPHLIRVLNTGADVFKSIAAQWKGRTCEEITNDERQQAKQVCYGMIYGIGAKALGEKLSVSQSDASSFMQSFKSKYPGIDRYIRSVHEKCRQLGYVETLMGRRRPLPAINDNNSSKKAEAERQAVNTIVQGMAADIAKRATIDIDKQMEAAFAGTARPLGRSSSWHLSRSTESSSCSQEGPARGGHFVLQLHDELIYETIREDVNDVAKIIKKCMEGAVKLSVRLPVKVKIGPTWGDLAYVDI